LKIGDAEKQNKYKPLSTVELKAKARQPRSTVAEMATIFFLLDKKSQGLLQMLKDFQVRRQRILVQI
jgi:hypothetical protein